MDHIHRILRDVQIAAVGLSAGAGVIEAATDVPSAVHAAAGIAVLVATAVKAGIGAADAEASKSG